MKSLAEQVASYGSYHSDPRTKLTHFFGVPMVTLALFTFLAWFRFTHLEFPVTVATLFFLSVSIYYVILDRMVGALTFCLFLPLLVLAHFIAAAPFVKSIAWFLGLFIVGWIIQLLGHYFEGKRPAFMDNLSHVLNAPLFLTCEVLFKLNKRPDLRKKAEGEETETGF